MESRNGFHEITRIVQALWSLPASGICAWGICESMDGLSQVLGWRSSRHALYAVTGHFQNPGPFGGFIACVMAVAGAWLLRHPKDRSAGPGILSVVSRVTTALAWMALAAGLLVLPASMSRAGWLGLAIALGVEWPRVQPERQGLGGAFARVGSGAAEHSPIAPPGPLPSGSEAAATYTFRQDWYFFVGDNVTNSKDSRFIGFVPADFVIGIVI